MARQKNEPNSSRHLGYVAEGIADKVNQRDRQLLRACEAANKDPDVFAIETEMDAVTDEITEPGIDTPSR
jgi:hypothetical protein